ncbi:MAG: hypothetical protein V1887_01175 [Candidatus Aenigmatarchaeota archaeon]
MLWHDVNKNICPVCRARFPTPTLKTAHYWKQCFSRANRRLEENPFR